MEKLTLLVLALWIVASSDEASSATNLMVADEAVQDTRTNLAALGGTCGATECASDEACVLEIPGVRRGSAGGAPPEPVCRKVPAACLPRPDCVCLDEVTFCGSGRCYIGPPGLTSVQCRYE